MRTKLCWRHSRNFHFFISACSLMMVISFYLLFICTDYFLYKLELYFYWLHVSFFIVRALKKFQKRILLGFGLGFCWFATAEAAEGGSFLEVRGVLQSPSALLRKPSNHSSWALHRLTRKALPLQSIQKSLGSQRSVCACVHVYKMNSLYAPCPLNPYISTPRSPSAS